MAGEAGGASFAVLQDRLAGGLRMAPTAADLIVFDLAALAGEHHTQLDFGARWGAVCSLLAVPRPRRAEARAWLSSSLLEPRDSHVVMAAYTTIIATQLMRS
jgi:hypothetical protein